ncbi:type IX secretion/gliding motility protein PorT/SprT [Raineya sp.]|jgi:hypothetical protein
MKKTCIAFCFYLLSLNMVFAQGHITHLDDYDEKPMHYGFVLGLNHSWFSIRTSDLNASSNWIVNNKPAWGFSVGLAATFQPAELLAIRLSPTAVFGQRIIQFQDANTKQITEKIVENTTAEFPLMLKIKSLRRHNARMFMIAGIKPYFSLGTKASQEPERIRIRNAGFAIEYGFGTERFYEMFKFAPEIRFTHTLGNLLVPDDNQFTNQIRSLVSHSVSVYLFFE